jgi:hypothetical protein
MATMSGPLAASVLALASPRCAGADNWIDVEPRRRESVRAGSGAEEPDPSSRPSPAGIKLTRRRDADGKTYVARTAKFDGTDAAWTGNPNADTASPKRMDANHYRNVWKKDGKATVTADVMVSKDGKTLTVTQTGKDAKGRAMKTVEVFDRLQLEGTIPADVRFQVQYPTPLASMTGTIAPEDMPAVAAAYESALFADLATLRRSWTSPAPWPPRTSPPSIPWRTAPATAGRSWSS